MCPSTADLFRAASAGENSFHRIEIVYLRTLTLRKGKADTLQYTGLSLDQAVQLLIPIVKSHVRSPISNIFVGVAALGKAEKSTRGHTLISRFHLNQTVDG